MKMEVTQVLNDIALFQTFVSETRFMRKDGHWDSDTLIDNCRWRGRVVLVTEAKKLIAERLASYGIKADVITTSDNKSGVQFDAVATDEIIQVLQRAMAGQKMWNTVKSQAAELAGLKQEVNALLTVLSNARGGMFHRGMKAVKNQANTVANVMQIYKENKKSR